MCFSESASFIAGGGLVALGSASFVVAKKEDKVLAAIPLLFGLQQLAEGVQWQYLNSGSYSLVAAYIFLVFAFIVWPIYVPSFVYILDKKRQKILKYFMFLGIIVAVYFLGLLIYEPITVQKLGLCISYNYNLPFRDLVLITYLSAIFVPLFLSSHKAFRWFGVLAFILAVVAWQFFFLVFTSVWCFFAAIVSSVFFVYVYKPKIVEKFLK